MKKTYLRRVSLSALAVLPCACTSIVDITPDNPTPDEEPVEPDPVEEIEDEILELGRPNIVLFIADDCRMRDLHCNGNEFSITPNIDQLYAEGMHFNRFFQCCPTSSPTRHNLLTGQYPVKTGAYPNHTYLYSKETKTLPYYLKEAGYRVATQGKRHYNPLDQFPFEYLDAMSENGVSAKPERTRNFVKECAENKEKFFLYVCSREPHEPWNLGDQSKFDPEKIILPPNLVDTPKTRTEYAHYLAEINVMDSQVGQMMAIIEEYGLTDETMFIFTSEQGYSFPFAKWTLYDEGLQTTFIVRWPGVTEPGSEVNDKWEYVDVVPTLIDIAGGTDPGVLDGRSFKSVFNHAKNHGKDYVYGLQCSRGIYSGPDYYGIRSVRGDRYLYIRNLTPEARFKNTTVGKAYYKEWATAGADDPWAMKQYNRYQYRPGEELYDVINDPFNTVNLADSPVYALVLAQMSDLVDKWMESQGDLGQETEMQALEHMWANHDEDD